MQKKAQFYLLSALIIVVILAGLVAHVNYALTQPIPVKFYDLSENYEEEAVKVIDFGIFQQKDVEAYLENFTINFTEYALLKDPNLGLVYIYGNEEEITVANYAETEAGVITKTGSKQIPGFEEEAVSEISIDVGEEKFTRGVEQKRRNFEKVSKGIAAPGDWIAINLGGVLYDFKLASKDNFYIIFTTETEGEEWVDIGGILPEGMCPKGWICENGELCYQYYSYGTCKCYTDKTRKVEGTVSCEELYGPGYYCAAGECRPPEECIEWGDVTSLSCCGVQNTASECSGISIDNDERQGIKWCTNPFDAENRVCVNTDPTPHCADLPDLGVYDIFYSAGVLYFKIKNNDDDVTATGVTYTIDFGDGDTKSSSTNNINAGGHRTIQQSHTSYVTGTSYTITIIATASNGDRCDDDNTETVTVTA